MTPNTPDAEEVGYVLGFLFSAGRQQVVLIRKNKPKWQAGLLNGVGGKIEKGETPAEAMRREFKEECGIWSINWRNYGQMRGNGWAVHLFVASSDIIDSVVSKTDEQVEIVHLGTIRQAKLVSNLGWLIEMALDENDGKPFFADVCYDGVSHLLTIDELKKQNQELRQTIAGLEGKVRQFQTNSQNALGWFDFDHLNAAASGEVRLSGDAVRDLGYVKDLLESNIKL